MGSRLVATFELDGAVSKQAIRSALGALADDDLSASSPISAGGREAAVVVSDGTAVVRVIGHDGDWTKKSTQAVLDAVEAVDGIESVSDVEGGYESAESDSDDESGDDSSESDGDGSDDDAADDDSDE